MTDTHRNTTTAKEDEALHESTNRPSRKIGAKLESTMFSLKHRPVMDVRITGELIHKSMPSFAKNADGMIDLLPCIDLDTGEAGKMICTSVLASTFEEMEDPYIGKCFRFVRGPKPEGKEYYPVTIYPILDE